MFSSSKAVSLFKCGASIRNVYHQAQTRQSMKYLARKAFQYERLGPGTGAVMLKTTVPKSEVPQPQHGGLGGAAVAQGAGPWGPQGTLLPASAQELVGGHRHQSLSWDSVSQIRLPLTPLSPV